MSHVNERKMLYYSLQLFSIFLLFHRAFDESKGLTRLVFPDGGQNCNSVFKVYLLYRPGHYDVLYPRP